MRKRRSCLETVGGEEGERRRRGGPQLGGVTGVEDVSRLEKRGDWGNTPRKSSSIRHQ